MRTTSKEVKTKIRDHILSFYPKLKDLRADADACATINEVTYYQKILRLVADGQFLIWYHDVREFIKTLDLDNQDRDYTDDQVWKFYAHLVAREGEKLLK